MRGNVRSRKAERAARMGALLLAVAIFGAGGGAAQQASVPGKPAKPTHDATVHHRFDDAAYWSKVFDDPTRDAWQKPDAVLDFLGVKPGQVVADLGAGTGYFTVVMARHVGPGGKVFAVDIEPTLIEHIQARAEEAGLKQVVPVLAARNSSGLPRASVDLILVVDTWHHIDDRLRYLKRLRKTLAYGGRIAIVDYKPGEMPVGPPETLRLPKQAIIDEFARVGFRLAAESDDLLPYQFVLVFEI